MDIVAVGIGSGLSAGTRRHWCEITLSLSLFIYYLGPAVRNHSQSPFTFSCAWAIAPILVWNNTRLHAHAKKPLRPFTNHPWRTTHIRRVCIQSNTGLALARASIHRAVSNKSWRNVMPALALGLECIPRQCRCLVCEASSPAPPTVRCDHPRPSVGSMT